MIQLNMFEKLPPNVAQIEWIREHIKSLPPINITEEQRQQAQRKIAEAYKLTSLRVKRSNLTEIIS